MTFLPVLDEEVVVLPLADVDAAAAAADDHAGARFADAQPGVVPGLARGDHADQRGASNSACGSARCSGSRVSSPSTAGSIVDGHARDRRGDATGESRRVEIGDRAGAAAAAADVLPEAFAADAERRDDADAGDDHTRVRHDGYL